MDQLRRRLPHVWAEGKRLFVTLHLHGSLPHALYPPPKQTERGTSLCLDGPISRLRQWWTALPETTAHRATGSGFHPLRRTASATLRTRSIRRHGEPWAPAGTAARKPQPILTNSKGLHGTRSESVARTHGPAILAGGILRPLGARRSGTEPYQRVH